MTQHRPHPGLPGTWIISPIGAEIPLAMNALCQVTKLRIIFNKKEKNMKNITGT